MKKSLGYVIIVIIGVISIASMMIRSEMVDNNLSKEQKIGEFYI